MRTVRVLLFLALAASQRRRGVPRGCKVKLILRSDVIRLGGAFRRDLGRALSHALRRTGRPEALRYRQQQEGSDCCSCGKSVHSLGLHVCCNMCVAMCVAKIGLTVRCVDLRLVELWLVKTWF